MLKFVVSTLAVATAFGRPEPPFTLRDARQMAQPHILGHHLENIEPPAGLAPPHVDPKPDRPLPTPPEGWTHRDVMKATPILPGSHSLPSRIRALHGEHGDRHHGDDDHDHRRGDGDHVFMHIPERGMMSKAGPLKPSPGMMNKPAPMAGKPAPMAGKPAPMKPAPVKPAPDLLHGPASILKGKPAPGLILGPPNMPMKGKPGPGMMSRMAPPPPGPKMPPPPKAKPSPLMSLASSRDEVSVDELADEAQQQCQQDYARLCSPRSGVFSSSLGGASGFHGAGMPSPQDMLVLDVFMMDKMDNAANTMEMPEPCDLEAGDDDDDDDADDDDAEVVMINSPLLDVVQNMFNTLRLTRPIPPTSGVINTVNVPRKLWATRYQDDYVMYDEELVLGFGSSGDMCLLDNFDRLSTQCQDSIDDLEMAVYDFDMDDDEGCPMMGIVLILLLLVLMLRCIARRRMMKRQDTMQTTLAAIHASPELKAKVEAASGVPLPPTLPGCRFRNTMAQKPWYVKVLCVLGMFLVSFWIVLNSMLITGAIVNGIYADQDEEPSPVVVLAILFATVTLEVFLVKRLRMAICAYLNTPPTPATASSGTTSAGNGDGNASEGARLPQIFQRMRSVQLSSLLPARLSTSSTPTGPQYQPLLSEEDYEEQGNTEMMLVSASAPPSNEPVTTIPVVVTPMGYAPSNVKSSIAMF